MGKTFNTGTLVNGLSTDANGNVGINTSSPAFRLDVTGTGRFTSTLATGGDITITKSSDASFIANNTSASGKSYRLVSKDDGKFYIQNTGVADLITITSSGNLGINTSSPSELLHINSSAASAEIRLQTSAMSSYIRSQSDNLNFYINNGERMRITSTGNVGIGTSDIVSTNLTGALTIRKSYNGDTPNGATTQAYYANQSALYLFGRNSGLTIISNNTEEGSIIFGNNSTNAYASIKTGSGSSATGGDMYFQVGSNTERMRISSSGTLSINGPRFIQQGLSRLCYAGTINGNQSITITLNVGSQSAVKITAAMNHYGYIDGYGCARMSWVGASPAFSEINISNVTSGNGGSWSFTHGGGGVINIIKNAGSYGGGGYFFVEVIGNDPISIA